MPMYSLIQDARFTLRLLRKRRGVTALVVLALAVGIGLNTAIFSVLNAVLLRPLPLFEADRVVRLTTKANRSGGTFGTSYADYLDWKRDSKSFSSMAAMRALSFTMTGNGTAEHLKGMGISASGFQSWGVSVSLGRGFTDDDDLSDSSLVAILNSAFWQRKFGADPAALGKRLVLDGKSYTIVGVLQPTQIGTLQYPDVYVANGPLIDQLAMKRDSRLFFLVARLKAGVSLVQAQTEMDVIASRLAAQYPDSNKGMGVSLVSEVDLLTADGRQPLPLLIVASSLIFILTCVNVVTVLLGNLIERRKELSVRLALGSGRWVLIRQLLLQAVLLAAVGDALGLLLAKLGLAFFLNRFPDAFFRFQETTIDSRAIWATVGMALLASLAGTLIPAIYVLRLRINSELKGDLNSSFPLKSRAVGQGALIFFEVALATALSLLSGLLVKSLYEVEKVDLGFDPHQILSFQINLPASHYKIPAQQSAFYKRAFERLKAEPAMQSSSGISGLPLTTQGEANPLDVEGKLEGEHTLVEDEAVLPGFFQTMKLPMISGRDFSDADHEGTPFVIIVDDVLAAKLWPGQNPLGKRVRMPDRGGSTSRSLEVVGVVREIKHFGPEAKVRLMQVYVPQYQDPSPMLSFVINTTLAEPSAKLAAEKTLHELDRDLPVESFQTMDFYLNSYFSGRKVTAILLTLFAVIGTVLGVVGVFGVVSNTVVRRRREVAIRLALGATTRSTMILVIRNGLFATIGGIVAGSFIVFGLKRLLSSFLFGISPLYPAVYLVSALILVALTTLASVVPASRLLGVDVQQILRE